MEGGVAGDKVGERWVKGGEGRRRDKGNVIQHTSYGETEKAEKKMVSHWGSNPGPSGFKASVLPGSLYSTQNWSMPPSGVY